MVSKVSWPTRPCIAAHEKPKATPAAAPPSTPAPAAAPSTAPVPSTPAPAAAAAPSTSIAETPTPASASASAPEALAPAPAASSNPNAPTSFREPRVSPCCETSSRLVSGAQLQSATESMIEMGFPREQVVRALRASFNNPDRAVEYLFSVSWVVATGFTCI